ncbi:MAG TPA: hypothetical protein DCS07_17990 [Bdellovibrionales bacterium]|nr:MAG: hypothetical protein A2Z97_10215 [Bdellovibrionales bacterium GWB1_52_6]OFZ05291.1 MAG: hypothetical protein A2X97_10925 [Bdellovibrionales bacterium GWA1_52_35]HAR44493.1 hypothetical protein [Bdellovibrionales bacterium]HCM38569.1 hypothetical protein [Bdellovibrionales bacterium]
MKTLTEFTALQIKNAAKTKQDLITAGKTPEELPQALGEALKIEGDKLNFLINALDLPMQKTSDLKRVIVMALGEGEQVPSNAAQKGEQVYVAEYYAPLHGATPPQKAGHGDRDSRGGRGGRGGPGRGKNDRRDQKGGGQGRGPRKDGAGPGAGPAKRPVITPKA